MAFRDREWSSTPTPDEINSRLARLIMGNDEEKLRLSEELESRGNREYDELIPKENPKKQEPDSSFASSLAWMVINTLATIGIVFINKAIFSDPSLKLMQLSFAAFHFLVTFLTLFLISRRPFTLFVPRRVPLLDILPLSLAMALNVILPNLSLAFSTVVVYQLARILLTPTVAVLNYALYRAALPFHAVLALVPTCLGVAAVSYYDSLPPPNPDNDNHPAKTTPPVNSNSTAPVGILFALLGVLASSLYTIWIGAYHRRLQLSSMQLLYNQAPVSFGLLLYAIPFVDVLASSPFSSSSLAPSAPSLAQNETHRLPLGLVLLSGLFASLINLSQFFIVARAGAVSSTVVGHVKTCLIVALGWVVSGRGVGVGDARGRGSVGGVVVALGGIMAYSVIMLREKEKAASKGAT